jgi:hypothetical protein
MGRQARVPHQREHRLEIGRAFGREHRAACIERRHGGPGCRRQRRVGLREPTQGFERIRLGPRAAANRRPSRRLDERAKSGMISQRARLTERRDDTRAARCEAL